MLSELQFSSVRFLAVLEVAETINYIPPAHTDVKNACFKVQIYILD